MLFEDIEYRWVDCYFPFTHPSWELEILYQDKWLEVLGCGIIEQEILHNAGADGKLGFAFGLGLERLAMKLYQIPDIRLFWSEDTGFTSQFITDDPNEEIVYKVREYKLADQRATKCMGGTFCQQLMSKLKLKFSVLLLWAISNEHFCP